MISVRFSKLPIPTLSSSFFTYYCVCEKVSERCGSLVTGN
jgi:hypothetical protein